MLYLVEEDLVVLFQIIYDNYARSEEVPRYQDERIGIEKVKGVFQGVRMDEFYPGFFDKASYLFTQINEGHFFSNGNKRLALVVAIAFIYLNRHRFKKISKDEYKTNLSRLFSRYTEWQDYDEFLPGEFGLYNLSIIVADNRRYVASFDELKGKVKEFLSLSVESDIE
jgi:prophage maintenance system killer protein